MLRARSVATVVGANNATRVGKEGKKGVKSFSRFKMMA